MKLNLIRQRRDKIASLPYMKNVPLGIKVPLSNDSDVVFVYGTFQPGYGLYSSIADNVIGYIPDAIACGFSMYAIGYPWAMRSKDNSIWGTLLYLAKASEALVYMDYIELGAGYDRERVWIDTPYGQISAWMYVYNHKPRGKLIESGDFLSVRHG